MTDCIVVGGGISGLLSARLLAEQGVTVEVFDRGAFGAESSWAGGGIVSPLYPWRYADAVNVLAQYGQRVYERLAQALREESGVDPEWTPSGLLVADVEVGAAAWAGRWGVNLQPVESSGALEAIQPGLVLETSRLAWMPEVAQVRNPRLMRALIRACEHNPRIRMHAHTAVEAVEVDRGRVLGVRTAAGLHAAGQVLVAAGAWSKALVPGPVESRPDVFPVKGQMIQFQTPPGTLARMVLRGGHYLIPRRDGLVLAGSTLEQTGFDKSVDTVARDELKDFAIGILPSLAEMPVVKQWAGLRPGAPEGIPYIGPLPQAEGLFINAGHYRNGVVTGPGAARLAVDLMLGLSPTVDPAPYAPISRQGA